MKQTLRSTICVLATVLSSALTVCADGPPPPAAPAPAGTLGTPGDGPRIKFDNDTFDAGKAAAGQPLNHTFIFTNVGNQTLEVAKVNPTCGCTVAGNWTRKVEPGQTGTIPISVNVNQMWSGQMMKTLTVESNDKSRPGPAAISIKFTVWKPIEISQQYVFLNIPPEATNVVSTVVRVDNNMDEPLALYDAKTSIPQVSVDIKTNEVGKHYELFVSALPPFHQGHPGNGQITAKTSSTNMPNLAISANVNILPVLNVNPPQIVLEPGPLTNLVEKAVTIQYMGSSSLHVSNAVFSAKGVDVQVNESQPGRVFTVKLSFPPGFEASGKPMTLALNSSSPQMPVITVNVNQQPRPSHPIVPLKAPTAGVTPVTPASPPAARVSAH